MSRRARRWRVAFGVALASGAAVAASTPRAARAQRVASAGVRAAATAELGAGLARSGVAPSASVGVREVAQAGSVDGASAVGRAQNLRGFRDARWAPVASALLPGTGQAMLDQDRFLPYLALEAYAWLRYLADSREGARQRDSYRRLARAVARSQFSTATPTGNWEYYERMEHYVESGVYDALPGGSLDPEPDTTTYNGSVWLLARQTYWEDPNVAPDPASTAYLNAVAFYAQRAVTAQYRWSWRDAQLEQDLFRRTIRRSNDYYRRAAQDAAVVIANHVLSTVDSYVTVRLRSRRGVAGPGSRSPGEAYSRPALDDGYDLTVRVPLPRR